VITRPSGPVTTPTWDENGNLRFEEPDGVYLGHGEPVSGGERTGRDGSYQYRGDGNRQRKEGGGNVTLFLWDGENLLREQVETLGLIARYTNYSGYWGGLAVSRG
jgi:hypothetical protein